MAAAEADAGLLPFSVITGFLGSGKTTLLSRLIADPRMANALVIINEFGEVALDHLLVARPAEDVVLLSSGCLCCTVRGELVDTLSKLWAQRARGEIPAFDRVLVETTGLADPVPVLLTVTADPDLSRLFRLEKVLTVVDAVNGSAQLAHYSESVKQACVADDLLVSKTDVADPDACASLWAELRRLNPGAAMIDVQHGTIDPGILFDFSSTSARSGADIQRWLGLVGHDHGDAHGGSHHHGHDRHAAIRSFAAVIDDEVTPAGLELWLNLMTGLRGTKLLRVKGLLNVGGRPTVVHAVQNFFHPPVELPDWPDADRRSRLVFITDGMDQAEVEKTLGALSFRLPVPAPGVIDPEAFRQFSAIARTFA